MDRGTNIGRQRSSLLRFFSRPSTLFTASKAKREAKNERAAYVGEWDRWDAWEPCKILHKFGPVLLSGNVPRFLTPRFCINAFFYISDCFSLEFPAACGIH